MSTATSDPFDFFQPQFAANPYPYYDWLRANDPIHWGIAADVGETGMWHLGRYADIMQVLRDARFAHRSRPPAADLPEPVALFLQLAGQSLLFNNPPDHTRLRALVGKAFTPRAVEDLRPLITTTAAALLDKAEAAATFDVVGDYALPLTMTIIATMLGIPDDVQSQVPQWARALVSAIDCKQSTDSFYQAGVVAQELYQCFLEIIERYRREPQDTILGRMITAHDADDRLSEAEIIVTATTLLVAGHETTVNLIGNGAYALLRFPDQFALLREHPELAASAVEEFLRFESPSQMTSREATATVTIDGQTIEQGQLVNLLIGSGNRDPVAFAYPDHLDITRQENRHLAFGMGIHYCLGAPLARMEGQIAIPALLQRFPHLQLANDGATWRNTIGFRGMQRLVVTG